MAASTPEEIQRSARRKRLAKGLLLGAAAVGVPALLNAWVGRGAARRPPLPRWGFVREYAWTHGEISFHQLGDGPPAVLLHSFGVGHHALEWRRAAEILAEDHRIYALDLLGWGHSARPAITYDAALYVRQIEDFLHDVVRQPALLLASGTSAAYAVQVAADQPRLVSTLGLVCPLGLGLHAGLPDARDALLHRLLRLPLLGRAALNVTSSRAAITSHLRDDVYAASERVDAGLVERHHRSSHQPGAQRALAAFMAGYLDHDVSALLPRLTRPVWLAWGRQAKSPAIDRSDQWLKDLPHAVLDVFDGTGTLPHAEAPEAFCRRLRAMLAEQPDEDTGERDRTS